MKKVLKQNLLIKQMTYHMLFDMTPYLEYLCWLLPLSLADVATYAKSRKYLRLFLVRSKESIEMRIDTHYLLYHRLEYPSFSTTTVDKLWITYIYGLIYAKYEVSTPNFYCI